MGNFLYKTSMKEAKPDNEKSEPSNNKFDPPNKVQTGNVPKTVKNGETSMKEAETEKEKSEPPKDEELPEFDPNKFKPGYVPKTVKKGEDEYAIVVTGVKDTGLCGGYWGNIEGKRRRCRSGRMRGAAVWAASTQTRARSLPSQPRRAPLPPPPPSPGRSR